MTVELQIAPPRPFGFLVEGAFAVGPMIADKYVVERELGAGGSGRVVLARHIELGHRVAIKMLRPESAASATVRERFKREARAAACLRSEHVVKIFDVDVLDDGTPYLVMEFLDGEDLAAVLERGGPLPVERAVAYVLEACDALAEAHRAGIVHRDLKPANLFLAKRPDGTPTVKIVDFGISKVAEPSADGSRPSQMTGTFERFGTPSYMPPEQIISSANVEARSDIWAIGVVLYELLTARLPFEGTDVRQVVASVLSSAPVPLRERRADVPPALDAIVRACLSHDANARPENVEALVERLAPFVADEPASRAEVSAIHAVGWANAAPSRAASYWAIVGGVGFTSVLMGAALFVGVCSSLSSAVPTHRTPAHVEVINPSEALFMNVSHLDAHADVSTVNMQARSSAPAASRHRHRASVSKPVETDDFGDRQ